MLVKLGLTLVLEDPYIFIANVIIVFFYVDDIIIINYLELVYIKKAINLDQEIKKQWELRELDTS